MQTLVPSTDKRLGAELSPFGEIPGVPDTLRDQEVVGGQEPLHTVPLAPLVRAAGPVDTAPFPAVTTEPLALPVPTPRGPVTPIATSPQDAPTFEVYGADDTFRGKQLVELDADARESRQQRIGLGVFAAALAIVTTLAAIGSCDDKETSSAETTAATMTAPQPSASVSAPNASATVPPPSTPSAPPAATSSTSPAPRRKSAIPKRR